jgi:tRNA pseudouridine55 synthase
MKRETLEVSGVLVVDKPSGITSFGVVDKVRRALRIRRVGHTGTLDPMATGVLPICVGEATKIVPYLLGADKRYVATVKLGVSTDTLDAEGQVVATDPPEAVARIDAAAFAAALTRFTGEITQRPPAFSAIKVDGRRLHERARAGEAVEAPERTVTIHALRLVEAAPPFFTFDVTCSKGTYVRSLAADVGAALGVGGHLTALRRLSAGPFTLDDARPLAELTAGPETASAALVPMAAALRHLPSVRLSGRALDDARHGRKFTLETAAPGVVVGLDPDGRLVALLEVPPAGPVRILRGFAAPVS